MGTELRTANHAQDHRHEDLSDIYSPNMPARDRFFAIDELVLEPLLQADATTLVVCTMVCPKFQDLIELSDELQRNMLFLPSDLRDSSDIEDILMNPVLRSHLGFTTPAPRALMSYNDKREVVTTVAGYEALRNLAWTRDGLEEMAAARRAFTRSEASWRRMHVSRPPMLQLECHHD